MPTPSEQKALAFVAIVVLLGGAVRVLKAGSAVEPTAAEQQALARQASAADSAASRGKSDKKGKRTRGGRGRAPDTIPNVVGGVSSVAPSFARPALPFAHSPYGFPPAGPRIDVGSAPALAPASPPASRGKHGADTSHINIDVASAEVIERLPRIGPATARRLVANRDSFGPFKTAQGLRRVKGMGPATIAKILPFVTFGPP